MWVYLEIEPDEPGLRVDLVKGDRKVGRYPVLYDATCRAVAEAVADVDALEGVVIPDFLGGGYNFDASLLILQLRLESTRLLVGAKCLQMSQVLCAVQQNHGSSV